MSGGMFDSLPDEDRNGIRRSLDGRPYIRQPCPRVDDHVDEDGEFDDSSGRVPSLKRPGRTIQCPECKGKGFKDVLYTRCTSFVGVLDDRSNLERWQKRIVLIGLGVDHGLLESLNRADPDDRDELDLIAAEAFEVGEGHEKARKGTSLHWLTEYVDDGRPLPETLTDEDGNVHPVTLQDRADMAAYRRLVAEHGIVILERERFVVNDFYQIGGTYDRLVKVPSSMGGTAYCWRCDRPNILDLKTGRVDYGAGKIAMQLAVYANSDNYDPKTGERTSQDVCRHVGIIVHLPQGTGEASILLADLVGGWADVHLAALVRQYRRQQKGRLTPLSLPQM